MLRQILVKPSASSGAHGRLIDKVEPFEEKMFAARKVAEKARPDVLQVTSADRSLGLPLPKPDGDGKFRFYDVATVDDLRKEKWSVAERSDKGSITIVPHENIVPSPKARARADEIVQAFDTWFAKYSKRPRGLRAAERRRDAACSKQSSLERRIEAMRATSLAGLVAKARCLKLQYRDGEIVSCFDDAAETLACSIGRDLLSMKAADPLAA
jgi:hypothetical protein